MQAFFIQGSGYHHNKKQAWIMFEKLAVVVVFAISESQNRP